MANVQPENGCIAIAHDLYLAINSSGFSALQLGVIAGVIYYTYGAGKTKAQINIDDIRSVMGGKTIRPNRVHTAVNELLSINVLFSQSLPNGSYLLGVQKDYEKWSIADKMSASLRDVNINNITTSSIDPDKMSAEQRLMEYAAKHSKFIHSIGTYRKELSTAKSLYNKYRLLLKDPIVAELLITDYLDELNKDDWFRRTVKFQFAYMSSRFEAWREQIPRKPREIRENEEALNCRYRYNVKTKSWEMVR